MNQSDRFALPLLEAGQAQKEITHNAALVAIDRLLHLAVVSKQVTTPPAGAAAGSAWIVPGAATGAWAGQAGTVAVWDGFGWAFVSPREGMSAWVADAALVTVFTGGGWSDGLWPATGLRIDGRAVLAAEPVAVVLPSGGSVIDTEGREALTALIAALRSQGIVT